MSESKDSLIAKESIKDSLSRDGQPTDGNHGESSGRKLPQKLDPALLYESDAPQYIGGIPKDIQDIIWLHNFYNHLSEEVQPLFEYQVDEIAGTNYFFHQFPPLMELDAKDISILINIVDESSFKGRDIELISKLRAKLVDVQSKLAQ